MKLVVEFPGWMVARRIGQVGLRVFFLFFLELGLGPESGQSPRHELAGRHSVRRGLSVGVRVVDRVPTSSGKGSEHPHALVREVVGEGGEGHGRRRGRGRSLGRHHARERRRTASPIQSGHDGRGKIGPQKLELGPRLRRGNRHPVQHGRSAPVDARSDLSDSARGRRGRARHRSRLGRATEVERRRKENRRPRRPRDDPGSRRLHSQGGSTDERLC